MNEFVVTETLRLHELLLRCFMCWAEIHLGKNRCSVWHLCSYVLNNSQ